MARLEAQSKLLYYPTPIHIAARIATWFTRPQAGEIRLADPCCGDGEALQFITNNIPDEAAATTLGIEISYSRAEEARKRLDVVLPTDFYPQRYPSRWSSGSVGFLFNNPPYDWSENFETKNGMHRLRHEVAFIEGCTPKVQVGGHHIIIVPRAILGDPKMLGSVADDAAFNPRIARHLLGWFEKVEAYRFDDEAYQQFRQVVIFAINKRERYHAPTNEQIAAIACQHDETYQMDVLANRNDTNFGLPFDVDPFIIPPAHGDFKFNYAPTNSQDLVAAAEKASITTTGEYARSTYVRPLGAPFHPAMPLCIGHVSMLITGQETGILQMPDQNNEPILIKGMARKVVEDVGDDHTDDEGRYTGTTVTQTERHEAAITIIKPDGTLSMLTSPTEVGDFMTTFVGRITDSLLERNQPTYDLKPIPSEWAKTAQSALGLPALPGRTERGLFPTQRHFAIAATRTMKQHGSAVVCAEMGFGKTSTSVASLELMGKFPALVMCPGHMVWKWKRDLERSSDPANPIIARVITKPAAVEPGSWYKIKAGLTALDCTITHTRRYQVDPKTPNDPGGRRSVTFPINYAIINQVNNTFWRETFKDPDTKETIAPKFTSADGIMTIDYVDRDDYTMFDFADDVSHGVLGSKSVAIIAFDPAKYDAGSDGPALLIKKWRNPETGKIELLERCPTCGEPITYDNKGKPARFCVSCKHALFSFTRWNRIGLAQLVKRQFRHFFKVYVADEVHKCQDGRTDIGAADQRFISATRYNLALTGTLFGGVAGSLFFLLYRRSPDVRKLYEFDEKIRWVDHYGLWEKTWDQKEPVAAGTGASTGIIRWNYRQRELPGISPAVIRFLLPITLFGNITDLGYELPPIYEQIEQLAMPPGLQSQYNDIEGSLLRQAIEAAKQKGDPGALSVWFNTARFRPASAFRDEIIDWTGKKGGHLSLDLPAVTNGHPLPKEQMLADDVTANMRQGNKTLLFVEQTGTRDIRDRLEQILKLHATAGRTCKVGILSAADMKPARRETWIKTKAPEIDVLIVNPKLVETGLDLVMFSEIIFYETTTSLYVLWQSMRRIWRLGQSKPVKCKFYAYSGTIEETILDRMGKKMKFAQLLYGKEAAGVLIETGGEDDIQRELIQAALEGKAFRNAGEMINIGGIFTNGSERTVQVSQAPTGSMVAASPVMPMPAQPAKQMTFFSDTGVVQLSLLPGFTSCDPAGIPTKKRHR